MGKREELDAMVAEVMETLDASNGTTVNEIVEQVILYFEEDFAKRRMTLWCHTAVNEGVDCANITLKEFDKNFSEEQEE